MKILMRNGSYFNTQRLFLGTTPVGVFDAQISLDDVEKERIVDFCHLIWKHLMDATGNPDFTGMIRFDLVPEFLNDGTMNPVGIYEVNAHSPECIAVAAALGQKNIVELLVDKIIETFGGRRIAFVVGRCDAKDAWAGILFDMLRECGLNIIRMSEDEVMRTRPPLMWRFGDLRTEPGDASHFSDNFSNWLLKNQSSLEIFNSILNSNCDFSRKSFLRESNDPDVSQIFGKNRALKSQDDIEWSLNLGHKNFVVKPDGGASGNGIHFGNKLSECEWVRVLSGLIDSGNYSIWEAKWLPNRDNLSYDVSPSFWVYNGEIHPLYTLVRVDYTEKYKERGVINVARGAGVAEMIPFAA